MAAINQSAIKNRIFIQNGFRGRIQGVGERSSYASISCCGAATKPLAKGHVFAGESSSTHDD